MYMCTLSCNLKNNIVMLHNICSTHVHEAESEILFILGQPLAHGATSKCPVAYLTMKNATATDEGGILTCSI